MTESCRERFELEITDLQDTIKYASDSVHQAESVLYTAVHELGLAARDVRGTNTSHLTRVLYLVRAVQTATKDALKHLERPMVRHDN